MQIAFASRELRALCEIETEARRLLGSEAADALKHRLADLQAASTVEELVVGSPRILEDEGGDLFAIDLPGGRRMMLTANHVKNPTTATGKLDWAQVSRLKLLRIEGRP